MKFKVGDRVRVVEDEDLLVPLGTELVVAFTDDSSIPYKCYWREAPYWFKPSELEVATEAPPRQFAPGDRVRVLADCNGALAPGTLGTVARRSMGAPKTECYIEVQGPGGGEFLMLDSELALVTDEATAPAPTYREAALAALVAQLKSEDPMVVFRAADRLLTVGE